MAVLISLCRANRPVPMLIWLTLWRRLPLWGAEGAVNILYRKATGEEKEQAMKEYAENFSNPYRAAEQGFIDEIIMPRQTRFKLIQALEMAKNKSQSNPPKKHGNMPL